MPWMLIQLDHHGKCSGDPSPTTSGMRWTATTKDVPQGKYLVNERGQVKYRVDPAINGTLNHRDDGTPVRKFKRRKTVLMALLTKGILTQKLPWTLVLLGVAIALVLELSGVPSLPFAVGVYLPLSSSTPIFVGGLMRYLADRAAASPAAARLPRRKTRWAPACCFLPATSRAGPSAPCLSPSSPSATRFPSS